MLPPHITHELNQLLGGDWRASAVDNAGYSHSPVLSIRSPKGRWALKRLDLASRDRVLECHAFQMQLAAEPECCVAALQRWPNESTWIERDGYGWERTSWIAGSPFPRRGAIEHESWGQIVQSLIAIHRRSVAVSKAVGPSTRIGGAPELPKGLRDRRTALRAWRHEGNHRWNALALRLQGRLPSHQVAWLKPLAESALAVAMGAAASLEAMCRRPHPSYWIVRDCWRDHWLFSGQRLVGLIDFGAARSDWPGLDLVRCFGTLLRWPDDRWQSGLESFRDAVPACRELRLGDLLLIHRVSVALSALQWLEWYGDGTFSPESIETNRRLRELSDQLGELVAFA